MLVQVISFLQAHQAAIGMVVVAILDFAIEVNPNLKGNNVISQVLAFFGKAPSQQPPAPPAA